MNDDIHITRMNKDNILARLESLQPDIQKKFHTRIKGIFGSYVRGDQKRESDLDILVEFGQEADLLDFVGLSDYLEEKFNQPVDLVPIANIREELKERILKEAIYL